LGGREHVAIKHFFLRQYLGALSFKTLQSQRGAQPSFAYIDGFTGPWGAKDENYLDTSFGVALDVLKRVKARLGNVQIRCVFCETRRKAFHDLEQYVETNADGIEVRCVYGKFEENIGDITNFIGKEGFLFAFIDPKGWNVDATAITPLLKGRWSEVLFNFMAEFIGRFPDYGEVNQAYAALLGDVDWRSRFEATPEHMSNDDRVLLLFRDLIKDRWGFSHVLELPIRKPKRTRIFYKLVYGTRSPYGVLAFREAQARAEKEGFAVAAQAAEGTQMGLFTFDEQAQQIAAAVGVGSPHNRARLHSAIIAKLQEAKHISFLRLAADVLETIPARERDVRAAVEAMRSAGLIACSSPNERQAVKPQTIITLIDGAA